MNWRRILIVAFWTFVVGMLAWQAYNYNHQVTAYSETHPEQHYFYNPGGATPLAPKAPNVRQVAYKVIPGSPQPGNFTVQFTVKNVGTVAATAIQVNVRPYRGVVQGDPDNDLRAGGGAPLKDDDPVSQFGKWVTLPDLAPGQSSSDSVVFVDQPNQRPNDNPKLDITFEPVKAN